MALFARRHAFEAAFGTWDCKLPMLVRSDNVSESFFRVLKRILLAGSSTTITGLLEAWKEHQSRIVANALDSNIDIRALLRVAPHVPLSMKITEEGEAEEEEGEYDSPENDSESETEEDLFAKMERGA